jgi:predicted enzyme related to lactoylglutathione lyase
MKTSGITAALPAQDPARAKAFYVEKVGLQALESRGVEFEEYDTPETRTENGIARMPGGGEAAWFKDSEGNLLGVVPA